MTEHTPYIIDDIESTDVYVATLELRSVGESPNIFPSIRFSHHFSQEPSLVPYSYQIIMAIAEKLGAVMEERDLSEAAADGDIDEAIRTLSDHLNSERNGIH
jgi:hypothetical protein